MIKVELEKMEGCRRKLRVEIAVERCREEYEKVLKNFLRSGDVPGFRKGKAPRDIIERKFADQIESEFRNQSYSLALQQAIDRESLKLYSIVRLENESVDLLEGLSCDWIVDLEPEFEVPRYKDIPIEKQEINVTDEDVEQNLERMREQLASFEKVEDEGYEAVAGDAVKIDYKGMLDGQPASETVEGADNFCAGEDAWAFAGTQISYIPEFSDDLVGATVGKSLEADVSYDDSHMAEGLRGKTVHYSIEVKEIQKRSTPELDDAFAARLGIENMEALRETVSVRIRQELEQQDRARKLNDIGAYLLEKCLFEVPQSLVEQEMRRDLQNMVNQSLQMGVSEDKLAEEKDALLDTARSMATRRMQLLYILLSVADSENIKATANEVNSRIAQIAQARKSTPERTRKELAANNQLGAIAEEVKANKAMEFIYANIAETEPEAK